MPVPERTNDSAGRKARVIALVEKLEREELDAINNRYSYKTSGPVMLSDEQIISLYKKLRFLHYVIHERIGGISAMAASMRLRPENAQDDEMVLLEFAKKIADSMKQFRETFEEAFGLSTAAHGNPHSVNP